MSTKWLLATNAACHVILWKMKWPKCLTSIIFRRTMNFQLGLCVSNVLLKTRSQQGHIQNRPTGRATSLKHTWVWIWLFGQINEEDLIRYRAATTGKIAFWPGFCGKVHIGLPKMCCVNPEVKMKCNLSSTIIQNYPSFLRYFIAYHYVLMILR